MIVGKIYFLLVRIKIKYMEIAILKREFVGTGPNLFHENETIAKYEIMDGAPVKGTFCDFLWFCWTIIEEFQASPSPSASFYPATT